MRHRILEDYFSFSKKERMGIFVLLGLIFMINISAFLIPYFTYNEPSDTSAFEEAISRLQTDSSQGSSALHQDQQKNYKTGSSGPESTVLFYFDPNTISAEDWIRLGVREKTAQTIRKYISRGGKFYKPEDIRKIWGLSAAQADRLIPYIQIKPALSAIKEEKMESNHKGPVLFSKKKEIDVNTADTTLFKSLPGIGTRLANRIVAFREKLGGFYSVEQVSETYLLPDSTFRNIRSSLVLADKEIRKININHASVNEMKMHPYIKYNLANAIYQYRQQHGSFHSVNDIRNIMIVTDDIYKKAVPYLTVD